MNRISAAAAHAPQFLHAVAAALDRLLDRHPQVTVLVIHGWNVGQPAVDLGIGVRPDHPTDVAAVSPAFRDGRLRALIAAAEDAGATTTLGARYPARAAENLVQLFTGRQRDSPDDLIRQLAAHAARVNAVQVELSLPLRLPGPWRDRLLTAWQRVLNQPLQTATPSPQMEPPQIPAPPTLALQMAGGELSGIVRITPAGGLLLLLLPNGQMLTFTGERVRHDGANCLTADITTTHLDVRFDGPCLLCPDTRAFEDLERHLGTARLVTVSAGLRFEPTQHSFGTVRGHLTIDGARQTIERVTGFTPPPPALTLLRLAAHLDRETRLTMEVANGTGDVVGALHRGDRRTDITRAAWHPLKPPAPYPLGLRLELADDALPAIQLESVQHVPVVRNAVGPSTHSLYATCRVLGTDHPTGWLELHRH